MLKGMAQVDAMLAVIQRDGVIIKRYCTASPEKIQAAIRAYKKRAYDAEYLALGVEFGMKQHIKEAKAVRRLSMRPRPA